MGQIDSTSIELWQAAASGVLVVVAIGLSMWRGLDVEKPLVVASARAAVQLLVVGYLFLAIVESDLAVTLAWLWAVVMVLISAGVARRRSPQLPGGWWLACAAIGASTAVCVGVVFGLGVLDATPVSIVVISGITIGNALPALVQAGQRLVSEVATNRSGIEQLLALGFDANGVVRFAGRDVTRLALVPQIERTNVVGLIALPGAMTGLLLAGVEPVDAVLIQLVVMYLVLGAVATSVTVVVVFGLRRCLTDDLRVVELAPG